VASIGNDPNGRKRILVVTSDGKRKTIRLGKMSLKDAQAFRTKVEALVTYGTTGVMSDETAAWLRALPDAIHTRLAVAGLDPERPNTHLAAFLDAYVARRVGVTAKKSTARIWSHTQRSLIAFFGADKPLQKITPGDADNWQLDLTKRQGKLGPHMADSTVRRRCGIAKQFFRAALRLKLITQNPFEDFKTTVKPNRERDRFITRQEAAKILDARPTAEWRLLFALCRYGGLRCPSEPLGLKWAEVDWAGGRLLVHFPKTAHHPGGESQLVPLFPELLPHLREAFEQAEPGAEYVIAKWRYGPGTNLRTTFLAILARAGLKPWPKLFQNLRATRETELNETWPIHKVCKWIGNSPRVANESYLQVTDEDYKKAAQNPAQYPAGLSLPERKSETANVQKSPDLPKDSESYTTLQQNSIGVSGFTR